MLLSKESKFFVQHGVVALPNISEPVPLFTGIGAQKLTLRAQSSKATVGENGITKHVSNITRSLTNTSIVSLEKLQDEQTRPTHIRNLCKSRQSRREKIRQKVIDKSAALILGGSKQLGRGADAAEAPADATINSIGHIARRTTAGFAVADVVQLVVILPFMVGF